jgi:hypothetical protein
VLQEEWFEIVEIGAGRLAQSCTLVQKEGASDTGGFRGCACPGCKWSEENLAGVGVGRHPGVRLALPRPRYLHFIRPAPLPFAIRTPSPSLSSLHVPSFLPWFLSRVSRVAPLCRYVVALLCPADPPGSPSPSSVVS